MIQKSLRTILINLDSYLSPVAQTIDAEGIFGASCQKKACTGIHEHGEVQGKPQLLTQILVDPQMVSMLTKPGGEAAFVEFLGGLANDQSSLYLEQRRFPPMQFWPKAIAAALKERKERGGDSGLPLVDAPLSHICEEIGRI